MRVVKVLIPVLLCVFLAACVPQGGDPVVNTASEADIVADAEEFLIEGHWQQHAYNTLVKVIFDEYGVDDTSSFKLQYISGLGFDEFGNSGDTNDSDANEYPCLYVIQDPSGATVVKVWHSRSSVKDWTWLYEYLYSTDISEFIDEKGVKVKLESGFAFFESQQFQEYCADNLDEVLFEERTELDIKKFGSSIELKPADKVHSWVYLCTLYAERFVYERLNEEGYPDSDRYGSNVREVDAMNLLLENGVTEI